jgi:hypothetical protein
MTSKLAKILLAGSLLVVLSAPGLAADRGDRINERLDNRGERINERLDNRGERVNDRLDARSERAAANGHEARAARLDARGNRIENHLDAKGNRIENHLDRKGNRIDRRLDRRHARRG